MIKQLFPNQALSDLCWEIHTREASRGGSFTWLTSIDALLNIAYSERSLKLVGEGNLDVLNKSYLFVMSEVEVSKMPKGLYFIVWYSNFSSTIKIYTFLKSARIFYQRITILC